MKFYVVLMVSNKSLISWLMSFKLYVCGGVSEYIHYIMAYVWSYFSPVILGYTAFMLMYQWVNEFLMITLDTQVIDLLTLFPLSVHLSAVLSLLHELITSYSLDFLLSLFIHDHNLWSQDILPQTLWFIFSLFILTSTYFPHSFSNFCL